MIPSWALSCFISEGRFISLAPQRKSLLFQSLLFENSPPFPTRLLLVPGSLSEHSLWNAITHNNRSQSLNFQSRVTLLRAPVADPLWAFAPKLQSSCYASEGWRFVLFLSDHLYLSPGLLGEFLDGYTHVCTCAHICIHLINIHNNSKTIVRQGTIFLKMPSFSRLHPT